MLFGIFFKLYNFLLWVLYVQLYYLMLWHNIRNLSNNSMYLVYLTSSCVNWARFTRVLNWPTHAKKAQFTHELFKQTTIKLQSQIHVRIPTLENQIQMNKFTDSFQKLI
jgi:hypothetical protein